MACLLILTGFAGIRAQNGFVSQTPQNRKVLLEEYTALHCANCPDGHKTAAALATKYPQDLFIMNIHGSALAAPLQDELELRTIYGDSLLWIAGVTSIPSGSLNRHHFDTTKKTVLFRNDWDEHIAQLTQMPACANIAAKARLDWQTRQISVTVQLYYTQQPEASSNFVHVAVVQDSIVGTQNGDYWNPAQRLPDGKYLHMHALRDFLTGQWGEKVNVEVGTIIEKTFTKTLPKEIGNVNLDFLNLQILAFVSEGKEEIINVCKAEVEEVNRPAYIAALSAPSQIEHTSCSKEVRFAIDFKSNPLSTQAIRKIRYACIGENSTEEYIYEPTQAVEPGQSIRFTTEPFALGKTNTEEKINFRLLSVNDDDFADQTVFPLSTQAIKYYGITENPDILLQVRQDRFGTDITWVLKDEAGDTVAHDGPYENLPYSGVELHDYPLTVAEGCHTFTIYDKSHDGINNGAGAGFVRMSEKDERLFINHPGKYTDSAVINFQIGKVEPDDPDNPDTVSIRVPQPQSMRVYPNPCRNVLKVELPEGDNTSISASILRMDGRRALQLHGPVHQINLESLPCGFYILEVQGNERVYRQKILKN